MTQTKEPEYKIISSNDIEIREYPPMLIAEVEVTGERKEAITEGFKILADYIFGNNISNDVTFIAKDTCEKIPMTAPVIQQKYHENWKVRFIMPRKYTIETLPKPNSQKITILSWPAKMYAVIQFSGTPKEEVISQQKEKLKNFIFIQKLKTIGEAILAFYNPPWTLPFLRRNEIMIELSEG